MIRESYPDLTDLWIDASRTMMTAGPIGSDGILDWKGSSETYSYSNLLRAESMSYAFDVGTDLSLNRSRFTTLQRAYLHPFDFEGFMARATKIGARGGTAGRGVLTTMTVRQKEGKKGRYANGPCIMGYGFRGGHRGPQPTITMHSRTSYLTYMGGMDLALCAVIARYVGEAIDIPPEDFAFEWHADSLCTHNYKQIPMSMVHHRDLIGKRKTYPSDNHPSLKLLRREWDIMLDKIDTRLEDEKWGARRRVWRRYREREGLMEGGVPSCPVESLTLDALFAYKNPAPIEPDMEYEDEEEDE